MRLRVLITGSERNFAGGALRYRRDVRGAAWQLASARRRAFHSCRVPDSGMASERRAGRPAGGLRRRRLHADRAGAGDADRSHRRTQNPDRRLGGQRARYIAVRHVRHRPVVGRPLQRDCRRGLCGRLYAGPQGADGSSRAGRFIPRHHALYVELLVRRRPVVSGFPTRCGSLGLAQRIFCHRRRAADDAHRLLAVAAGRTEAGVGTPAGFRAGVSKSESHGVRPRLRRALFRALRHPDLDRGVLDLCLAAKFRRFDPDADRGQRRVLAARHAREHSRQ